MTAFYSWLSSLAADGSLPEVFQYAFFVRGLLSICLLAPLLGGISHLVVVRRLSFFSAALGQAALTGLTIGLLVGEPLNAAYGGIFGFCFLSSLAMVYVKRHAALPTDTLVGVFLSLTLGLGICLLVAVTKQFNIHQVEAVMFGSLLTVTETDLMLLIGTVFAVGIVLAIIYNRLVLDSLDPALGQASGVPSAFLDYLFAALLTAAIVVSLKVIGALLIEAMVVVPAAAARNLARTTRGYLALSILTAFVAGTGGLFISSRLLVPSGGAVVLAMSSLFFVTLALGWVRTIVSQRGGHGQARGRIRTAEGIGTDIKGERLTQLAPAAAAFRVRVAFFIVCIAFLAYFVWARIWRGAPA